MTQPKWTPEPWIARGEELLAHRQIPGMGRHGRNEVSVIGNLGLPPEERRQNSVRTASCVSALTGIPDPAEFVAAAKELLMASKEKNEGVYVGTDERERAAYYGLKSAITCAEKAFGER